MSSIFVLGGTFAVWCAMVASFVWSNIAIFRTHEDRISILNAMPFRPVSFQALLAAYRAVTFHQHLRAIAMFRDPWKLYDPIVKDALDNPVQEVVITGPMPAGFGATEKPPSIN